MLISQLQRVEKRLGDGPWFNGAEFSLADTAFAPLFRQNSVAGGKLSVLDADSMPKVCAWAERLLALPEVRDSVVEDFPELYRTAIAASAGYGAARFAPELTLDRVGS